MRSPARRHRRRARAGEPRPAGGELVLDEPLTDEVTLALVHLSWEGGRPRQGELVDSDVVQVQSDRTPWELDRPSEPPPDAHFQRLRGQEIALYALCALVDDGNGEPGPEDLWVGASPTLLTYLREPGRRAGRELGGRGGP